VTALTDDEREILRVGCVFYEQPGAILNEIHRLGMSQERFFQQLNRLLDTESALAADPVNVNRLRRLRASTMSRRLR
jgi:hypothetical protein